MGLLEDLSKDDLSNVGQGKKNYCDLNQIKHDIEPLAEFYGIDIGWISITQCYFRNKRYKIILDMMEHGYPPDEIYKRTLFSKAMIKKVTENPNKAKEIMERKISNHD